MMNFDNLKKLREHLGMSQKDFAESLGFNKTTYNNYENGERDPKSDFWEIVVKKYGTSVDFLLGITDDMFWNSIKKAPPSEDEDADRMQLIENFDSMNAAGKNKLLEYSRLLLKDDQYLVCGQFGLGA